MGKDLEDKNPEQNDSAENLPMQLVFFYCRRDVCPPGLRIRRAKTLREARKAVTSDEIPVCPHGKMISDQRLRPI